MLTRTHRAGLEIREGSEGRTIAGLAVPYGVPTRIGPYVETMVRGVFADATAIPDAVKVMAAHAHDALPIGRAVTLSETDEGLQAELLVSDTAAGRDVLTLVRDGVATGLSVGFVPVVDAWSADRAAVTRVRASLLEVSIVAFPAYDDARIAAVRALASVPLLRLAQLRTTR
jgi:HK97 family phage prohead protease